MLRYPYEVRKQSDYFADIKEGKVPKDIAQSGVHIVGAKTRRF